MARSATQASGTLRFAGVRIRMRIEDGARKDHATRSQLAAAAARAAPAAFPLRLAVAVWSQWHWTRSSRADCRSCPNDAHNETP
jgi:hypothetical protein